MGHRTSPPPIEYGTDISLTIRIFMRQITSWFGGTVRHKANPMSRLERSFVGARLPAYG
jgi:hypothetical protein